MASLDYLLVAVVAIVEYALKEKKFEKNELTGACGGRCIQIEVRKLRTISLQVSCMAQ